MDDRLKGVGAGCSFLVGEGWVFWNLWIRGFAENTGATGSEAFLGWSVVERKWS